MNQFQAGNGKGDVHQSKGVGLFEEGKTGPAHGLPYRDAVEKPLQHLFGKGSGEALALEEILNVARAVAGDAHHFRAIQLPFNLAMPEGLTVSTQPSASGSVPVLQVAREHNLMVFASASLLQSKLARGLPDDVRAWFQGLKTDAQRAIQFVRSTPGITCALVGMANPKHVEENLATASVSRLSLEDFRAIFAKQ